MQKTRLTWSDEQTLAVQSSASSLGPAQSSNVDAARLGAGRR